MFQQRNLVLPPLWKPHRTLWREMFDWSTLFIAKLGWKEMLEDLLASYWWKEVQVLRLKVRALPQGEPERLASIAF